MRYYPLFLNLEQQIVVVIGGGPVAERKSAALLKAGACVKVISPRLTSRLTRWKTEGSVEVHARPYRRGDLKGARLAFVATDDAAVNEAVFREAKRRGVLLNRADLTKAGADTGGFIVPASFSKGGILVAVSTQGKSPALAKVIRNQLKEALPPTVSLLTELLARVKRILVEKKIPVEQRKKILTRLAESSLPALYAQGEIDQAEALIVQLSGLRRAEWAVRPKSKQKGIG